MFRSSLSTHRLAYKFFSSVALLKCKENYWWRPWRFFISISQFFFSLFWSKVHVSTDHRKSEGSTQYPCTYAGCGDKELVQVLCPFCEKHFCLKYVLYLSNQSTHTHLYCLWPYGFPITQYIFSRHRHQSDHECDKLEAPKHRMSATQQLVKEIVG